MTTKYTQTIIYTKYTDLMRWFDTAANGPCDERLANLKKRCAQPRDVQLIVLVRYESGHTYCKIKCPINPLPVKGEFEVPSMTAIDHFLIENNWFYKETIHINLLK